jgi:hypothetical protein
MELTGVGGRWAARCAAVLLGLAAGAAGPALGQAPGQVAPSPQGADAAPPESDPLDAIEALQQELAAQREELDRQREELEAQRAELEAVAGPQEDEDAELDALLEGVKGDNDAAEGVQAFEPKFRVYGFADMGLQRFWGTELVESQAATNALSFVLGQVNFYFDAEPVENWRVLTEVRFSLLPDGAQNTVEAAQMGTPVQITDTNIYDMTSPSGGFREVKLGGLILERAHIDYSVRDWLNFRVGLILTPYGIWNVDHGTPTLISTTFPGFQIVQLFPERQLGAEIFGRFHHKAWEYEYHLYVSNGRTMTQVDFTDDKAVGGRVVARTTRPFRMQFGASGFVGQYEEIDKRPTVGGDSLFETTEYLAYREQGIAADLSLDVGNMRIRSEFIARRVIHREGKRADPRVGNVAADRVDYGAYLLWAYRLPWWGLEPFVFMDFLKWPSGLGEALLMPSAGLNVHLNPSTVVKFQYTYLTFVDFKQDLPPIQHEHMHMIIGRLAIAF